MQQVGAGTLLNFVIRRVSPPDCKILFKIFHLSNKAGNLLHRNAVDKRGVLYILFVDRRQRGMRAILDRVHLSPCELICALFWIYKYGHRKTF
jgi:hypothetical protein